MGISRGYVIESQGNPRYLMDIVKANVLIDGAGHVRLADFGLLTIISDTTNLVSSSSFGQGGTVRWMSPELFDPEKFGLDDSRLTKYSDCYALGMLIYEVLSGQVPFSQYPSTAASAKVLKGERPGRPQAAEGTLFTDDIWRILERCWAPELGDRPSTEHVLQFWRKCQALGRHFLLGWWRTHRQRGHPYGTPLTQAPREVRKRVMHLPHLVWLRPSHCGRPAER